jgi:hypothetical protein
MLKIGTRSLLFGVHQVFIHPIWVAIAWLKLYGWKPDYPQPYYQSKAVYYLKYWAKLCFCFIVHDWGYWGGKEMDGPDGDKHPEYGAYLANKFLDRKVCVDNPAVYGTSFLVKSQKWHNFCLCHSRFYAKQLGLQPSKLCMADKLSLGLEPWWLYLPRAWLSGELKEYMKSAEPEGKHGHMNLTQVSAKEWYQSVQAYLINYAMEHKDGKVDIVTQV